MRKLFIFSAVAGSLILFSACEKEPRFNLQKIKQEVGASIQAIPSSKEKHLKALLRSIFPDKWQILGVFKVSQSETKYFEKYLVKVYSPYDHVIWNKFIWITKNGKLLTPIFYLVSNKTVSLIVPKKEKEIPLESIRWILNVERIALEGDIPISLTSGKKVVYLIWNPYCKLCFNNWKNIIKKARSKNIAIKLIPYHNVYYPLDNLYMLIYLLWQAQNEGLYAVLNKYYSASKSFEDFLENLKKETYTNLGKIPKTTFNSLGFSLREIAKTLQESYIYIAPTTVLLTKINPTVGLAEGYILVNQISFKIPKN